MPHSGPLASVRFPRAQTPQQNANLPLDLSSRRLSSKIVAFSDEFFAEAYNLLTPTPPIRQAGKFVESGAWYDGWETRRHNPEEADWVVVELGANRAVVHGIEIDTTYFNGNHAPEVSVEGTSEYKSPKDSQWSEILPKQDCGPNQKQFWLLPKPSDQVTHLRLRMYPDGGIARFRAWGVVVPNPSAYSPDAELDLASVLNGGVVVSASDAHFGQKENLNVPGRGENMGDGWETKRSRGEHIDWAIIRLCCPGEITRIVVDTLHFRGNFPREWKVQGIEHAGEGEPAHEDPGWVDLTSENVRGEKDVEREVAVGKGLREEVVKGRRFTHVKLVIIPDGGVKRIRVFGRKGC